MKRILSLLACVLMVGVACGGGSDTADVEGSAPEPATNAIEVELQEYAFNVSGEAAAGPLTINFRNIGEQFHQGILGKLDEGKTLKDVQDLIAKGPQGPPPPWFDDAPSDLSLLSPEAGSGMTVDAEPGTYVFLCFIPDPTGKPHVALGMANTFEVAGESDAGAPEPDETITLSEETVDAPNLEGGETVVEIVNDGTIKGDFNLVQFEEGKTIEDLDKYFGSLKGEPPATIFGGTHELEPGGSVVMTFTLEPGTYTALATYEGKKRNDVEGEFTVE
jgi:hypothetical protein